MLKNAGSIYGGAGGYKNSFYDGQTDVAVGGVGVVITQGAMVDNMGSITGGTGGASKYFPGGDGGSAVYLDGGVLTNAGTVAGGAPAPSPAPGLSYPRQGDAVQFGKIAGTLVVAPSAVFSGDIVANGAVDDTLVLSGTAGGSLAGLGSTITGFTTIDEDAGAYWRLDGSISGTGALTIGTGASLILDGKVSIAAIVFASGGNEMLRLYPLSEVSSVFSGFGAGDVISLPSIDAASLTYKHGTLTLLDAHKAALGTLLFKGNYTLSDFALQQGPHGSEVVFAGAVAPDFLAADLASGGHAVPLLDAGLIGGHLSFGHEPEGGLLAPPHWTLFTT